MSKIDEIIDLLPCPFCNETVEVGLGYRPHPLKPDEYHGVACLNCGAHGGFFKTEELAIKNWNTRTESPELAQTREALAAAEECVGHYADKNRWKSARGGTVRIYQVDSVADTGYDHAVKAQAEIKRLKGE